MRNRVITVRTDFYEFSFNQAGCLSWKKYPDCLRCLAFGSDAHITSWPDLDIRSHLGPALIRGYESSYRPFSTSYDLYLPGYSKFRDSKIIKLPEHCKPSRKAIQEFKDLLDSKILYKDDAKQP